jgi:nicotinamide-nucleotide amidase
VPEELLARVGAVSEEVARHMAEAALERSGAGLALSCTGIAGPGGGSAEKPVGLVHLAGARQGGPAVARRHVFGGDRAAIRLATLREALRIAHSLL